MANKVLRTSHQAHVYSECDVEASGGDSVDLEEGIRLQKTDFLLLTVFSTVLEINIKHRRAVKNKTCKSILYLPKAGLTVHPRS